MTKRCARRGPVTALTQATLTGGLPGRAGGGGRRGLPATPYPGQVPDPARDAPDAALVQVCGLRKSYGRTTALDGATWSAPAGAVTAVLGPNGAGKTTSIECCEGLRRPDGGTVRVLGLDPWSGGDRLRHRVGVMLQEGGLPTAARPLALLRHLAALHVDPLPLGPLVERLGIDAFARTSVRRLSGGQRQRLALAAAVVGRPEVVFLDEPAAGLDPHARVAVWELVGELRDQGAAVVLSTHQMNEAERLADHVVVLAGGRVVASGSPTDLVGALDPATGSSVVRFTARPALDLSPLRTALPPDVVLSEESPGRYLLVGQVDTLVLTSITTWCASQGVQPAGLSVAPHTLEDFYLQVTGGAAR